MEPVYTMKGAYDLLEVYEDSLSITPKGIAGFLNKGLKGTKTIQFTAITAIQFKKAGLTNGYLQFTLPGGNEFRGGVLNASSDENTFAFYNLRDSNVIAAEIKDYIEGRIKELRQPTTTAISISLSDELEKLAQLKANGALTDEEFQLAKNKLLDR